jgi:hypothetical protein
MLNKVTFTGIDNYCKTKELIELQKEYPFVEYGILVSHMHTNKRTEKRYPDLVMLKGLKRENLNLSIHICGKAAREIITKNSFTLFNELTKDYLPMFQRIQLNISGTKNCIPVAFDLSQEIIIQTKSDDITTLEMLKLDNSNVVGFQDNSGGKGIAENIWLESEDDYFGYAGGISPENVIDCIKSIDEIRNKPYWIDMESNIRTNDKFDITKCRSICELIIENKLIKL